MDVLTRGGFCGKDSAIATHLEPNSSPGAGYNSQGVTSSIEPVAVRGRLEILTLADRESATGGAPTRVGRDGRRMEDGEGDGEDGSASATPV
jgi:hypothetical protein